MKRMDAVRRWSGVLVLLCLAGCTTYQPVDWNERAGVRPAPPSDGDLAANGQRHQVTRGDTLSELAKRFGVPLRALAGANGLKPPYRLYAGQYLTIPSASGGTNASAPRAVAAVAPARRPAAPAPRARPEPVQVAALEPAAVEVIAPPLPRERIEASRSATEHAAPSLSGDGFLWPVRGSIVSAFGSKPNGTRNDGVNIRAAAGTPVLAAENGVVVFAGDEIPGYGQMLLVSHANGFLTAYAHNRELFVGVGDHVERGQRIASVGSSGNVTSPQLHFEVREGKEPVDPMLVLAPSSTQVASVR